jgi:hypothetical protein
MIESLVKSLSVRTVVIKSNFKFKILDTSGHNADKPQPQKNVFWYPDFTNYPDNSANPDTK